MNDVELILLGVALGTVPSASVAQLMVAYIAKKMGVSPNELRSYTNAADTSDEDTEENNNG